MMVSIMVLFLSSCENDVQEVKKLNTVDTEPLEIQEDLKLEYSDSSYTRLLLKAPRAETYSHLEEPYRLFPKGINVKFYDFYGRENSRLKANYAKEFIRQRLWEAKGDVVVVNKKGEQLNTELLFWDEKREKIYSDAFVKITTKDQIIKGTGFEADQDFSDYEITDVSGVIYLNEEDEESN